MIATTFLMSTDTWETPQLGPKGYTLLKCAHNKCCKWIALDTFEKNAVLFVCIEYRYQGRINSLRPRLNRRYFADDILKCNFLNENEWILPRISLNFVHKVRINNIPALVQIMAWRRPGDKPLSEPMVASFLTHICVARPQWVNSMLYIGLEKVPYFPWHISVRRGGVDALV